MSATHLHAMIIHFPIALLTVGFFLEMISLFTKMVLYKKAAFLLLLLGALGTVASYLTGNFAGEGIEEGSLKEALDMHERAANLSLWLTIVTAIVYLVAHVYKNKKVWMRVASVILFASVVGAIARTGYLGGQLVYKHGAGVQLELPDFNIPDAGDQ